MANLNALQSSIKGVFQDYMNTSTPASLIVAPILAQDTATGQYLYFDKNNFPSQDTPSRKVGGPEGGFARGSTSLKRATVETIYRAGKREYLSDRDVQAIEALSNINLANMIIKKVTDDIFADHVSEVATAIAALGGSESLNLTAQNAPVLVTFRKVVRDILKATGRRPTHVYLGPTAYDRLLEQDEVQNGVAITGWTSSAANVRRTGAPDMDYLDAWFKSKLGLSVVREDFVWAETGGSNDFMIDTTCAVLTVGAGEAPSTFKTPYQVLDRGGDLVDFYVEKAGLNANVAPGTFIAADAQFTIWTPDSASGQKISLTL